jgi:hypothetical protein
VVNYTSTAVYSEGSLYLFGGTTVQLTSDNRLYKYDVGLENWSVVAAADSPPERYLHGSCLIGTKLYILPGWNDVIQKDIGTFNSIDLSAPSKWAEVAVKDPRSLSRRDSYSYTCIGSKAYVFAGWSLSEGIHNDLLMLNFGNTLRS